MTQTTHPPDRMSVGRIEPHVKRIAIVIVLGSIMSVLDTTIVNVALREPSRRTCTPPSTTSSGWSRAICWRWLLSSRLSAWADRRSGAYRVYMPSLILFTRRFGLCALATSAPGAHRFRVLQGLAGAARSHRPDHLVQAAGRENLPKVMSAIGVPIVLAPVFGPTLGGLLLQSVGWHAISRGQRPDRGRHGLVAVATAPS